MDCTGCTDWLTSNWLDWPRPVVVRDHLAQCPACRAECARIAAMSNTLDGLPWVSPPDSLRGKVLLAVNAAEVAPQNRPKIHTQAGQAPSARHLAQGRVLFSMAVCTLFAVIGLGLPISLDNAPDSNPDWAIDSSPGSSPLSRKNGSAWPFWTNTVQQESKKALEVAYRCVRPAAEVSWVTMSKAIREAPGPFALAGGS